MKNRATSSASPSRIRQRIARLRSQRREVEAALLRPRSGMIAACLIQRRRLAGGKLRRTPAWYLSEKVDGKTRLTYVRKEQLAAVRQGTALWKEFAADVARWVKLTGAIERLLRELGKAQVRKSGGE